MANQEHLDILSQGRGAWNKWRKDYPEIQPDLCEADLSATSLTGFNLSRTNLADAELVNARLDGADLSGANLSNARLFLARIISANLREANLNNAIFLEANVSNSALTDANLIETNFTRAVLNAINLSDANLTKANFTEATLRGATLKKAILKSACLVEANLTGANLTGADLTGAMLQGARLVETNLTGAILTDCHVYGISTWDVRLEGAIQKNLVITLADQPTISVDNLEVAQFLYLLLEHKKLRDVLNSVTEKGVLILGRFGGGGLELLQAVAEKLREMKYLPIIFDFDRPEGRNLTETVMTLVGLSRFVIVDLSGPSVPNELRSTVPHFRIPFVPIIEGSRNVYSMFADFLEDEWVLSPVEFTSKEHLLVLLPSMVIEPAEKKCEERQKRLKQIFNR